MSNYSDTPNLSVTDKPTMADFLFCVPRYHTNMQPWVRVLQDSGYTVSIHATLQAPTEDHRRVKPQIIPPGWLSRQLLKFAPGSAANKRRSFPSVISYWRILKDENPRVIVVRNITRSFSIVAAVCAVLQRRKVVIYDQESACPPKWTSTWLRRSISKSVKIDQFTARLASPKDIQCAGSTQFIPFGCPFREFKDSFPAQKPHNEIPKILMVAKYRERKGHHTLLEALAKLPPELEYSLTFCGEETSHADKIFREELEASATNLGIRKNISFLANVSPPKMQAVYLDHDIFILPSAREPAAVSPVEAAYCGLVVIVSKDSGTRGYILDKEISEVESLSPQCIYERLTLILQTKDTLRSLQEQTYRYTQSITNDQRVLRSFESYIAP